MIKFIQIIFLLKLILSVSSQKSVFCYWTYWGSSTSNSNPSLCSHLSYAFVDVDGNGALAYSSGMSTFKALRNNYPSVKLLISIGGANYGPDSVFKTISASSSLRSNFASNVLRYIQDNNLNGVDIDWEYPNYQAANFVLLLRALYDLLHPRGYLVTIAVGADNSLASNRYDVPNIAQNVDFVNLMTYDYHGTWEYSTGINAPLYSSFDTIYTVHRTTQDWISKIGSNRNKLLLGIPLYSARWSLTSGNTGVGAQATPMVNQPLTYREICFNVRNGWTRVFDNVQKAPYAYGNNQWVGYDDAQSIQEKINYINNNQLGGAMFWEMSMDDYSGQCGAGQWPLMSLVKNALIGGSSPTQTPAPTTKAPTTRAPAPTTTQSSNGWFVCPYGGIFDNTADCVSFFNCGYAGQSVQATYCGSGLRWNDVIKACDWSYNVPC